MTPPAEIIIPTRHRADYLAVALASVREPAAAAGVPVLVIDDADPPDPATRRAAAAAGARYEANPRPGRGINGARNAGTAATTAPLLLFLDDDVRADAGWLPALLAARTRAGTTWASSPAPSGPAWRATDC